MDTLLILAALTLGAGAGWEAHHLRTRALVGRLLAASRATSGQHRRAVLAHYAGRLHIRRLP